MTSVLQTVPPTNRLAREASPYLRQHQHNPVNWQPWGEEAFTQARSENKPIFLSIGYATCHWCHVMERESLTDVKVARFLNQHFVCIKVDREERPDVDKIYLSYHFGKTMPPGVVEPDRARSKLPAEKRVARANMRRVNRRRRESALKNPRK